MREEDDDLQANLQLLTRTRKDYEKRMNTRLVGQRKKLREGTHFETRNAVHERGAIGLQRFV